MKKKIKWGIIGLGKIANKFAKGLSSVHNSELYAVASRDIDKAHAFSKEFKAEKACGSYAELMRDSEVDAIYIATPHAFHHELTMECIKHGKAVLCEKPFAINSVQANEMIELARKHKVFLMEALWTRFLPHFQFVTEKLRSGDLGMIKSLKADFGFKAKYDESGRLFNKSLGGGSLLDIGIYPVFMAYSLLGMPNDLEAKAKFTETEVDINCDIKFNYKQGIQAKLYSTLEEKTPTTAEIELEKGKIVLNPRFHEPTSVTIFSEGKEENIDFGIETNGYNFEAEHVAKMILQGKTESDIWSLDHTRDLMNLLDQIREKIGLEY
ncbi:Gfo/Idh/MocA family oxidoreductase [Gramella lutea]|uniref:Gfo/Idh/MocA family oxidoreductase n=1 Tax=Christiangramia lutea TaxID=1607951 RepID=A0A9X1V3P9_9FLAO|nr:Gfo/Idh/MocA family oxidoreductase [Christiangramia lutea]MCH4823295.1 Gfo/Idh/MocA family oxidoreductase [Christiangramia lutea]